MSAATDAREMIAEALTTEYEIWKKSLSGEPYRIVVLDSKKEALARLERSRRHNPDARFEVVRVTRKIMEDAA